MRISLLTLVMFAAMETDTKVLILFLALLPAAGVVCFVALMLAPAARRRPKSERRDNSRWRGYHRRTRRGTVHGRHEPARGQRLKGVSRQAQLEERTEQITVEDVARIYGVPAALLEHREGVPVAAHEHKPYRDGVRIRCRTCRVDLDRPEGMPEVGKGGFWSWSGDTVSSRPPRPKSAPPPPPLASGRGA